MAKKLKPDDGFPDQLRALMEEQNVGLRELARKVEDSATASGTMLSQILRGHATPSTDYIRRVARALKVDPSRFPEYRLDQVRDAVDWRPRQGAPLPSRRQHLKRALSRARDLGIDV